jgi:hypothetical protein
MPRSQPGNAAGRQSLPCANGARGHFSRGAAAVPRNAFCGPKFRTLFWSALRRWGEQAVAAGVVTIADLRDGVIAACTPPQDNEPLVPLTGIGAGDTAPGDALLRFIVDIERSKVNWLRKFRLIRSDQQDDLLAIMTGLKCLGQPPNISRIA